MTRQRGVGKALIQAKEHEPDGTVCPLRCPSEKQSLASARIFARQGFLGRPQFPRHLGKFVDLAIRASSLM
jgi:hypothetical protein